MTHRILLADDSVTIRKVVELTFSDEDFTIDSVGDGSLALERAGAQRPDIIISDVNMPGLDGYELCRKIKDDPGLRTVPFLLLKGTFESFDDQKARSCGADGFIVKPFESQEMISRVKELIAGATQAPSAAPAAPAAPAPRPMAPPSIPVQPPAGPRGAVIPPSPAFPLPPREAVAPPPPHSPPPPAPARPIAPPVPQRPLPAAAPPQRPAASAPAFPARPPAAPAVPPFRPAPAAPPAPPVPPRPERPITVAPPPPAAPVPAVQPPRPPVSVPTPVHTPTTVQTPPQPPPRPAAAVPVDDFGFDFGEVDTERVVPAASAQPAPVPEPSAETNEDLWSEVSLRDTATDPLAARPGAAPVDWFDDASQAAHSQAAEESPDEDMFEEVSAARPAPPSDREPRMAEAPPPPPVPVVPRQPPPVPEAPASAPPVVEQELIERIVGERLEAAVRQVLEPVVKELARAMIESVAWEVIPELAEAMIRAEIERIRQSTGTD